MGLFSVSLDFDARPGRWAKARKHHQLCGSLAASVVFVTGVGQLHGAVTTFTNEYAWRVAVGAAGGFSATIIGFNFFPEGTAISNQFSHAGFEFVPQDGRFPMTIDQVVTNGLTNGLLSTPLLPDTGQTIHWRFTLPTTAVGWSRTSSNDTHLYRAARGHFLFSEASGRLSLECSR